MSGKVHAFIGVGSLGALCIAAPTGFNFMGITILPEIGLITAAFGSYLPDIDLARSHMGASHPKLSAFINKHGGHRGALTHSLLLTAICAGGIYAVAYFLGMIQILACVLMSLIFGVGFGCLFHVLADLFNGKGCPIFWPIMKDKVHIADLPSDGFIPWIFAILVVGAQYFYVLYKEGYLWYLIQYLPL